MRRISPIPEDIDLDMGDAASPDGQDLRMLVDELKDVMAAERPGRTGAGGLRARTDARGRRVP